MPDAEKNICIVAGADFDADATLHFAVFEYDDKFYVEKSGLISPKWR